MRLHKLRKQHGMTLQQVADAAGFSRSLISKIETGSVSPPVATLTRLAAALGVTVSHLLGETDDRTTVHCAAATVAAKGLTITDKGYGFFAFATERADKTMQPYLFVARKGRVKPQALSHPGQEFVYVMSGRMQFRVGSVAYTLAPGDSLYFDSDEPHDLTPLSKEVRYLAVFCSAATPV